MSIVFTDSREMPKEFRQADMGRYGDAGSDAVNFIEKASPWDFLKGVFVDKPAAAAANQAVIAQAQAQSAAMMQSQQQDTLRTAMLLGGGVLALLAIVSVLRRPAPARVGGYRRSKRSRSRSRN